ncbi:Fe(3+) ions import ATP-binding protein FbpC [Geodia barretti]|uniref:Fe(3+) ions import ATP-binding protein FbpC n=1 Tax=Geodia barretti TaxID=519541 RepID=A0AA35SLH3_GEOBA|nr:Fe(3+) ions import ATP-binding protein FbpC [Geodia barretti]
MFARSKQNPQSTSVAAISEGYALELRGVSKSFGATQAVADVNIDLQRGEILCLLGPSGCGKTTTLRLIAGFDTPDSGVVRIGNRTVYGGGANESPERRRIGMVFQEGALFPHLTVEQNIAFGLPRGRQRKQQVAESLRTVGLEGYGERYPHELSGGVLEQQHDCLADSRSADLILMDEPFSSLDPGLRDQLRQDVAAILRARNATVVCVTHDQEEAMQLGDRVAVMQDGRIEQLGSPEEVFHHPDTQFAAEFFGTADLSVPRGGWPISCQRVGPRAVAGSCLS